MENAMIKKLTLTQEKTSDLTEDYLVIDAQKGDLKAFNQLVFLYQDRIFAHAMRILGDEDSAEDITQDTFLSAYRNLSRFRNGSFRSWLYRIATNACYDVLRRRKSHPALSLDYEEELGEIDLPADSFSSSNIMPEKEFDRRELGQAVQQALNRLDPDQRAAVALVDLQDFDYQEAAQILGIPVGTLKSRLARARFQLRRLLIDLGGV